MRAPESRRRARALLGCAAVLAVSLSAGAARALTYERTYPVSELYLEYALDHPRHIPLQQLLDLEVGLHAEDEAYVAPRPVDRTVRIRLSALPQRARFGASALLHINQYIVSTFNRRGYNGVIVTVPDIEEGSGRDLRPPGETRLRVRIWTGRISRVTSFADGERFGGLEASERTNHAAHEWIRERSPVRPGGPRGLLSVVSLEDYAAEVSRHPGRRVDVELEPGERTGTSDVNLRVTENKPWYVYAQYSNTGTSTTTKNRERFGFTHNQLLGRDDILLLDYTTGDFEDVHSVIGAYAAPFTLEHPEWRFGVTGSYNRFDARESGFTGTDVDGSLASAGGELVRQLYQHHELFVDAALGLRWQRMEVENRQLQTVELRSQLDYLLPQAELRVARDTASSTLRGRLGVTGGWTDTDDSDLEFASVPGQPPVGVPVLDLFGNARADDDFALANLDLSVSFYLEPLIQGAAWLDPASRGTLAHELAFQARGQWALGFRLIPHFQQVAGGFATVRGYSQSAVVGDNLVLGSAEYRLHIPRLFAPDSTPPELPGMGAFRLRPPHVWGAPDWDLIVRVFTDTAYVTASHALESEPNETLFSVGGGLELQVLRYLVLRGDVGYVVGGDLDRGRRGRGHARPRGRDFALLGERRAWNRF